MRKLVLFATTLFVISTASAQEIKFGAKAGVNLASINGDNADLYDMRTSFHLGAVAEIGISEKFFVQPELLYSAQGAKIDDIVDVTLQLDYLNLPIMGKYFVIEGLSIEAGPQIGYNINAQVEFDGETEDADDVSKIDFGVNFGLGYKLEQGIFFNARYNLGLSNIYDGEDDATKNQNGVFQISVGYLF